MKTFSLKPKDINRKWFLLDAAEAPLGRLATLAAGLLIGKGKTSVTPHIDNGDFVVVINAADLVVTGQKRQKKVFYRHSGYPGGLKAQSLQTALDVNPAAVVQKAVRGMLPVNKLRDGRLARLKVYTGPEHNHAAQQPQALNFKEKI